MHASKGEEKRVPELKFTLKAISEILVVWNKFISVTVVVWPKKGGEKIWLLANLYTVL